MDYKVLVEKLFDLFKDFLALVLGEEKFAELEKDVDFILGNEEA